MSDDLKCPHCGWAAKNRISLGTHIGMKHKGKAGTDSGTGFNAPKPGGSVEVRAEPAVNPYPPLAQFKADEAQRSGGPLPGSTPPGSPPAGPIPGAAAVFDSTGLWKAAAAIVNELLPEDAPLKLTLSDAEAKALDESLRQMGFLVEQRTQQTIIPWYAPFAITFLSTFGLPIVAALVPLIRSKIEDASKRRKTRSERMRPGSVPDHAGPMTPGDDTSPGEAPRQVMAPTSPEAIPAQPFRGPGE